MIKTGRGKPVLRFSPRHNDMCHVFEAEYYVPDWYWVSLDNWIKITDFEATHPELDPDDSAQILLFKSRLERLLKMAGGQTVWQLSTLAKNKCDTIRIVSVLGEPAHVIWTPFDIYVRRPFNLIRAWILNKFYLKKAAK